MPQFANPLFLLLALLIPPLLWWWLRQRRAALRYPAVGWLLGGTVGVGTVVYAACIGPLAHIFVPLFSRSNPAPASAQARNETGISLRSSVVKLGFHLPRRGSEPPR